MVIACKLLEHKVKSCDWLWKVAIGHARFMTLSIKSAIVYKNFSLSIAQGLLTRPEVAQGQGQGQRSQGQGQGQGQRSQGQGQGQGQRSQGRQGQGQRSQGWGNSRPFFGKLLTTFFAKLTRPFFAKLTTFFGKLRTLKKIYKNIKFSPYSCKINKAKGKAKSCDKSPGL